MAYLIAIIVGIFMGFVLNYLTELISRRKKKATKQVSIEHIIRCIAPNGSEQRSMDKVVSVLKTNQIVPEFLINFSDGQCIELKNKDRTC